ncbi:MAG: sigma 54-interacting transcriptional regulator [Desulfomonilaceae bacterium]|nr:sigma 54-interacting transcriptional regulator [Desulfomonilaceae bacterium]
MLPPATQKPNQLHKRDPLEDFPEDVREKLRQTGRIKEYRAGAVIVSPGDPGHRVRLLVSGRAAVILGEQDASDIEVETLSAGDIVGEISYLMERPSPFNTRVVAVEPCEVLEIPAPEFDEILRENSNAAVSVLRKLSKKVMRLDQNVYRKTRRKRALQELISRQDHLFPDYFVSQTVQRRAGKRLDELAHSQRPVLVTGESGVGKEFLAHAIYEKSTHHKGILLYLDLLRPFADGASGSELGQPSDSDPTDEQMRLFFGSEEGNVQQPGTARAGYIELTEEGTLVVRGIELLTRTMQERLLETLQTGSFRRVGGKNRIQADFRLIGTTNLDAEEISQEKHPLLYYLLGNSLSVPPLRKRRKEIPSLVEHYLTQYCKELRKQIDGLPKETIKTLVSYSWPGNERELATTLKRAVLLAEDGVLRPQDIYFDLRRIEADGKLNLMRLQSLRAILRNPLFPAVLQSAAAPFFFILLVLLFLGPADPVDNLGGLFSWAVGWPTMIFGAFFWARFWCTLCPMGTLSNLAKKVLALEIPFPASLKRASDWILVGSVMFIIWLETATDIRNSPWNTGILLLTIFLLAVIVSVIFERQSWCRYLCPLGGMMGVFAKVSPLELRADRNVCASQCTSNECFVGVGNRPGCPFGQMVPSLRTNRFCKLCATCVKNCPHGAVNLNLRVPGREIWEIRQFASVTALLVVSMFAGLLSELMHQMPIYESWSNLFPGLPQLVVFTLFFLMVIPAANLVVYLASAISHRESGETLNENFARYGLALLPLVLTSYMAFHLYYLIHMGVHLPLILWQTFKFEIFHQMIVTVSPSFTHTLQNLLVWLGLSGTLVIGYRLSRGKQNRVVPALREFLPHGVVAVCFAVVVIHAVGQFFYR